MIFATFPLSDVSYHIKNLHVYIAAPAEPSMAVIIALSVVGGVALVAIIVVVILVRVSIHTGLNMLLINLILVTFN